MVKVRSGWSASARLGDSRKGKGKIQEGRLDSQ